MKTVYERSLGEESSVVIFEYANGVLEVCENHYGGEFMTVEEFNAEQLQEAIELADSL